MCAAVPVALLLLVIFAALTVVRLTGNHAPNGSLLADLHQHFAPGTRNGNTNRAPSEKDSLRPASGRPPRSLSQS